MQAIPQSVKRVGEFQFIEFSIMKDDGALRIDKDCGIEDVLVGPFDEPGANIHVVLACGMAESAAGFAVGDFVRGECG